MKLYVNLTSTSIYCDPGMFVEEEDNILSAIVPSQMARFSGTNVTQPSVTLSPSESISLVMGIPGFIYALLELAGLFEWKAKHWKSRTPVVIR